MLGRRYSYVQILSNFQTKRLIFGIKKYSTCIHINDAYILSAVRTPIGSFQGKLASLTAVQLGTKALTAALERSNICKDEIQEFVLGCCLPTGLGQSPDRQIALSSGLSTSTISSTVNKLCASGMKAVMIAAQLISTNSQEVVAAGGTESLTHVPYMLRRRNLRLGNIHLPDLILHDGLIDVVDQVDVTAFAEMTAKEYNMTREIQDEYALQSYCNAAKALEDGMFADEIVPITIKKKDCEEVICEDEEIKRLDVDKFFKLPPQMGKDGTITVGNSSNLNDGAAMLIMASGNYVLKKNLTPLARIVSYADGAVEPRKFALAPAITIPRALLKANLTVDNITLWEISETFALTPLVNADILRIDKSRLNIHGGAISLGHPFGMTGARLICHLAHCLPKGTLGCVSISHAAGGASAMVIEKMC